MENQGAVATKESNGEGTGAGMRPFNTAKNEMPNGSAGEPEQGIAVLPAELPETEHRVADYAAMCNVQSLSFSNGMRNFAAGAKATAQFHGVDGEVEFGNDAAKCWLKRSTSAMLRTLMPGHQPHVTLTPEGVQPNPVADPVAQTIVNVVGRMFDENNNFCVAVVYDSTGTPHCFSSSGKGMSKLDMADELHAAARELTELAQREMADGGDHQALA